MNWNSPFLRLVLIDIQCRCTTTLQVVLLGEARKQHSELSNWYSSPMIEEMQAQLAQHTATQRVAVRNASVHACLQLSELSNWYSYPMI